MQNTGKWGNIPSFFEPVLLFFLFFIPAILSQQADTVNPGIFNSYSFNLYSILTLIPRIVILLYLLFLRKVTFQNYGIIPFKPKYLLKSLLYLVILLLSVTIITLLLNVLHALSGIEFQSIPWKLTNYSVIPLIAISFFCTGYWEELFFRCYLITEFKKMGASSGTALLISSAAFASGHIYQGFSGFLITLVLGTVLGLLFLRKPNIHTIAVAHGAYNLGVMIMSIFIN